MVKLMAKKILIVDDDEHIREVVQYALENAGFEVIEAGDGQRVLELVPLEAPDLIVLDITMPELDGLGVCRELRKTSDVPILFLSSRAEEVDRVVGLEIGGDDYVVKPFSPRELVARVQTILKRTQIQQRKATDKKWLTWGSVRLDVAGHRVFWRDRNVALTATEFAFLQTLLQGPERVHTREQLMDHAYDGHTIVSDRTIDSHVRHLRAKFAKAGADDIVETVHGVGYKLGPCR